MNGGGSSIRRIVLLALTGCGCFFLAAQASHLGSDQPNGLTAIWAANAVLLALLLKVGRDAPATAALSIGAFVGAILSSAAGGQVGALSIVFASANIVEALSAALILRLLGATPGLLARMRDVLAFVAAAALAPLISAPIAGIGLSMAKTVSIVSGIFGWYVAAVLGLALVTPGIITAIELTDAATRRPLCRRQVSEVMLVLGLVAATSIFVFYVARHEALFMLMPCILLATFRLRQFGAVAATGIIALVAATATAQGFGPIAVAEVASRSGQLIYLQVFLATIFLSSLPIAAALADRDARAEEAHLIADHFKAVVENAGDAIFRTDLAGRWTYLNPAWEHLSGYGTAQSVGRSWCDCIDPAEHGEVAEWARPVFSGEVGSSRRMLRFRTAAGAVRWMELTIQPLTDKDGAVVGTTGTLRDVHERKRLEDQVMSAKRLAEERERAATLLAATDELTGLQNRRAFLAQLEQQIETANATGGDLAVAIFDVDHFKAVNDRYGHAVGDRVLQRVAERAIGVVRSGDLVGRIGGEEFGILMPGASPEGAAVIAERLRVALETEAAPDEEALPAVTVSIGIAPHAPGRIGSALLVDADAALYSAKGAGRNRIKVAA